VGRIALLVAGTLAASLLPLGPAAADEPATSSRSPRQASDPVRQRPDRVSAMLAAQAQKSRVEVTGDRTDTSTTFANPNGTVTVEHSAGPVRVRHGDGWADVDLSLERAGGVLRPKASPVDLEVGSGGRAPLATLREKGSAAAMSWPEVLPAPTLADGVARYRLDDVTTVQVQATAGGFEQTTVLAERPAAGPTYRLPLELSGLTAKTLADGTVQLRDRDGTAVFEVASPVMWDARTDPDTGAPSHVQPVEMQMQDHPGGVELVLEPSWEFLTDPATVYPVTIDPVVSSVAREVDTWVANNTSAGNGSSGYLHTGRNTSNVLHRAYLKFQPLSNGLDSSKTIQGASLQLYNYKAGSCTPSTVSVHRVTTSWPATAMTWTNQPPVSLWDAYSGQASFAKGYSAACPADYASIDMTAMVRGWVTGAIPNNGFVIRVNESLASDFHSFCSMDQIRMAPCPTGATMPTLSVTYNTPPATPSGSQMFVDEASGDSWGCATGAGRPWIADPRPVLAAVVSDGDGGTVTGNFEVWPTGGGGAIWSGAGSSVSGGEAAAQVGSGVLGHNGTYSWRVLASDGVDSSGWSPFCEFSVDSAAPATPMITSSGGYRAGDWVDTAPGSNTFSWTGGDSGSGVSGWLYSRDGEPDQWTTSPSIAWAPANGRHTLTVAAVDGVGNVSADAVFRFGVGGAAMAPDMPAKGSRSTSTFALKATAPEGATSAYVLRSLAGANTFQPAAADSLKLSSTGATWAGSVTADPVGSATPALIWHAEKEQTALPAPALVEVKMCFKYANDGLADKCTAPVAVQRVPHAFGGSFPTEAAGPGQVALFTGEFATSATDVTVPAYQGSLSLGRSHTTFAGPTAGPAAVFGPGWAADLTGPDAGAGDLRARDNTTVDGTIVLTAGDGQTFTYRQPSQATVPLEAGIYSGIGETALDGSKLEVTAGGEIRLTDDAGTLTVWTKPAGSNDWVVDRIVEPAQAGTTTYLRDGQGRVTRILAPAPPGVDCAGALVAGCRALDIVYSPDATPAPAAGTYGEFAGRVARVDLQIFNPDKAGGAGMDTVTVARYAYSSTGLLRQVWDPRLDKGDGSHLATEYTYETAGSRTRLTSISPPGLRPYTVGYDTAGEDGRISYVEREDPALGQTPRTTVVYDVPTSGAGLPDLTTGKVDDWGQTTAPSYAAAVFPPSHRPSATTPGAVGSGEWEWAALSYTDPVGRTLNTAAFGAGAWQYDARSYDTKGNLVTALTPANRAAAAAAEAATGSGPALAQELATLTEWTATGLLRDTWGPSHEATLDDGTVVRGRAHTRNTYSSEATGELLLRTETGVTDAGRTWAADRDVAATTFGYDKIDAADAQEGSGWTLRAPTAVTTAADTAQASTRITRYDTAGRVIETRQPASDGTDAGTTVTVYWTAGANPRDGAGANPTGASCGNKPQWAGTVCRTGPAAQPAGTPMPVTRSTGYTALLAPTAVREDSGPATRTTTTSYDAVGRVTSIAVDVTGMPAGTPTEPVPTQTVEYNSDTGLPTAVRAGGDSITTGFDTWGRVTSYTDADANTATTGYDLDGRVRTFDDGKGTYTYSYDGTDAAGRVERRGLLTGLDAGLGTEPDTFAAAYDGDGQLVREDYPNGLRATRTVDETGELTGLAYAKGGTDWLAWTVRSSATGQTRDQAGPNGSHQTYGYDKLGRLETVTDRGPSATDCQTRVYGFDRNSNRTQYTELSGTTCPPAPSDLGAAEHGYDTADRIIDSGYDYDPLGRTTTAPAAAVAGGTTLQVRYHVNDMVARLTQGSTEKTFTLDPARRVRTATDTTGGATTETAVNHYADPGDSPAWIAETTGGTTSWVRNVVGIGGDLVAQQRPGGTTLQLANPHGDIVATADNTTDAAGPTAYFEQTEYGAPRAGNATNPDRYGWLGTKRRSSDALAGLTLMGVRLYNPAGGRFLSVDPVAGASATAYDYCNADPVDCVDLDGRAPFTAREAAVCNSWGTRICANAVAITVAVRAYTRGWHNDVKADAIRHFMWQALLTVYVGSTRAHQLGDAHEYPDLRSPDPLVRSSARIDLHNNSVARQWASKSPGVRAAKMFGFAATFAYVRREAGQKYANYSLWRDYGILR
jgi:RHS repeat-associated protein